MSFLLGIVGLSVLPKIGGIPGIPNSSPSNIFTSLGLGPILDSFSGIVSGCINTFQGIGTYLPYIIIGGGALGIIYVVKKFKG
jgi:hypothetical protein